jgi:hypothetical protein
MHTGIWSSQGAKKATTEPPYRVALKESADLDHYARVFSGALGRTIRYRDAPTSQWTEKLRAAGLPEHVVHHLTVMTELHKQGRMTG